MISDMDIAIRLIMSAVLGGLIGLERESMERPAGFRTHILVCTGSTLIMMISMFAFIGVPTFDPGRIAAQVVSGIGFLGAGTIIREGVSVKGLTTAASLWVVAGIGLAVGCGFYFAAIFTTGLIFLVLVVFAHAERLLICNKLYQHVKIVVRDQPGQIGRIGVMLGSFGISIKNLSLHHIPDSDKLTVDFMVRVPVEVDMSKVFERLQEIDGVYIVEHS